MEAPAAKTRLAGAAQDATKRLAKEVAKKTAKSAVAGSLKVPLLVIAILVLIVALFWGIAVVTVLFGGGSSSGAGSAEIPTEFMPLYLEAEEKYGVPWSLGCDPPRETTFSTNLADSSVGATGHMQFMKRTWVGWRYPGGTELGDLAISDAELTDPESLSGTAAMASMRTVTAAPTL